MCIVKDRLQCPSPFPPLAAVLPSIAAIHLPLAAKKKKALEADGGGMTAGKKRCSYASTSKYCAAQAAFLAHI